MRLPAMFVCLSVCPSVCWQDYSKTLNFTSTL